jgi:small membrane protein
MIFEIIITLFVLFALTRSIIRYKKNEIDFGTFIFWLVLWVVVLLVVYVPRFLGGLAHLTGIGRGIDLAVYLAIIILFYLLFKAYVKMEKLKQEITLVVRNSAIKNSDGKIHKD